VIGVDVSMSRLDIADSQGKIRKTISNTAAAIKKAFVQKLKDGDSVFVVCEATGGYEKQLVKTLQDAGISVAIANPRQVRQFASAMGRLEKSDPIDAEVICQFGQTAELPAAPVKTAEQEARDAVVRRREPRQAAEGCDRRLHAKAADHPQQYDPNKDQVENERRGKGDG
jgi:transposase